MDKNIIWGCIYHLLFGINLIFFRYLFLYNFLYENLTYFERTLLEIYYKLLLWNFKQFKLLYENHRTFDLFSKAERGQEDERLNVLLKQVFLVPDRKWCPSTVWSTPQSGSSPHAVRCSLCSTHRAPHVVAHTHGYLHPTLLEHARVSMKVTGARMVSVGLPLVWYRLVFF